MTSEGGNNKITKNKDINKSNNRFISNWQGGSFK